MLETQNDDHIKTRTTTTTTTVLHESLVDDTPDVEQNKAQTPLLQEDVGFGLTDTAEQKLQYSLDELIEQQQQKTLVKTQQNTNKRFYKGYRNEKKNAMKDQEQTCNNKVSYSGPAFRKKSCQNSFRTHPYAYNPAKEQQHHYASVFNYPQKVFSHNLKNTTNFMPANGITPFPSTVMPFNCIPSPFNTVMRKTTGSAAAAVADVTLSEIEILYPPKKNTEENLTDTLEKTKNENDDALIVKFKGTEVLKVRRSKGELILNSNGWRTLSTRTILNCALKPLGLWIEPASEKTLKASQESLSNKNGTGQTSLPTLQSTDWVITDGMAYLATFQDDMVIGQVGMRSYSHLSARASVIAQHLKQIKNNALARRQQRFCSRP